jgi:hypothetical protein
VSKPPRSKDGEDVRSLVGCPFRRKIRRLKFGFLLPTQERGYTDSHGSGGFFSRSVRKRRDDGVFFLSTEFCAVALHLRSPAIICAIRLAFRCDQSDSCRDAVVTE